MNIPERTFEEYGGNLDHYKAIYQYTNMYLENNEIAELLDIAPATVKIYKVRLKKVTASLPADDLTQEALFGYLTMSDMMQQDMMQVYLEMREDRDIFRNNIPVTDNKRRTRVLAKDLLALQQTLLKTQLERAAVLSKFAAVHSSKSIGIINSTIKPQALIASNIDTADIIDIETKELMN